jgi:hypothetical protein
MSIRVEHRDSSVERRVVIGMITDAGVLGRIASKWETETLQARWSNLVGGWCVKYFRQYGKAPGKDIEAMFEAWALDGADEETTKIVEAFLSGLSGEYARIAQQTNADYLIDLAGKHINRVKLTRLAEAILGDIAAGDIERAEQRAAAHHTVEMGEGSVVDVLHDYEAIKAAFKEKGRPLINYTGALGTFFDDSFERDAFVAFEGPEKVGKTWWLLDVAWRGMLAKHRVAFFEVGDLSKNQIIRRFMIRAARRPLKPGICRKPINIIHGPDDMYASVDFDEREFKHPLSPAAAWAAAQRITGGAGEPLLKLSIHRANSISVYGVEAQLDRWEKEIQWVPDIVIVDYADILAPPSRSLESRDQINETWMGLRAISQRHCLLVAASQTNTASYEADVIDRGHFSGDKRKNAHVTAMIGLNVHEPEKEQMLTRLNYVELREGEFTRSKCVHVAGSLGIANPAMLSTF